MTETRLPRRVRVAEIVQGRYEPGKKPLSWDERTAGVEEIRTVDGESLRIFSTGGQSTPAPGWELLLTKTHSLAETGTTEKVGTDSTSADDSEAVLWTLYGLGK